MQLVGDRQAQQVGDDRAIERREQRGRHERAELGGIGHVGEHLHHADQGADHAESRRAVAHRAIDFLPLVEVGEEDVAVALEIIADEIGIIAVGDEADAFGKEGIVDLDLLEPDRPLLAGEVGKAGDLVNQLALGGAAQREGELGAERQAVEDRVQREADQGRGKRTAEDDDHRVVAKKTPQIATHQHEGDDHDRAGNKAEAGGDIHESTPTHAALRAPSRATRPPGTLAPPRLKSRKG